MRQLSSYARKVFELNLKYRGSERARFHSYHDSHCLGKGFTRRYPYTWKLSDTWPYIWRRA